MTATREILTDSERAHVIAYYLDSHPWLRGQLESAPTDAAAALAAKHTIGDSWSGFVSGGWWASSDSKAVIVEETPRLGHMSVPAANGRGMAYDRCPRVTWREFAQHVRSPGLYVDQVAEPVAETPADPRDVVEAASRPVTAATPPDDPQLGLEWSEAVGGLQAVAFPEFAPKDPDTGRVKPEQLALL